MGQLPGFLKERAARMAASPRMYNVAVSNVPGPRVSRSSRPGSEVEAIYPVIPITDGHALAIGVLTYRTRFTSPATSTPRRCPRRRSSGS